MRSSAARSGRPNIASPAIAALLSQGGLVVEDDMTKLITLTRGYAAIVDDADYENLSRWNWRVLEHTPRLTYAVRKRRRGEDTKAFPHVVRMHRQMLGLGRSAVDGIEVDHVNGNGLDNRRGNLRLCTRKENARNSSCHFDGSSRFHGVSWYARDGIWVAQIWLAPKNVYLGRFSDEIMAAKAYDAAAKEYFGVYARLNFGEQS